MKAIYDLFEDKARAGDGQYAIAFAILDLTDKVKSMSLAIDRLGMNSASPTSGPGVLEAVVLSLESIASSVSQVSSSIDQHGG